MEKIISLFQRNYEGDFLVRNEVTPGAEWVIEGGGKATRKYNGTCCMVRDGILWKRYQVKPNRVVPAGFEPASPVDSVTGKQQGWVEVGDGAEDKWHREAMRDDLPDGTYELIGPKIQGNPEGVYTHMLVPHGEQILFDVPRDYEGIRAYLLAHELEGIVWHHRDGRMVKIKRRDFFS